MNLMVKDTQLTSIADAIRTKGGTSGQISFPDGFVTKVNNLHQLKTKNDVAYLNAGNSAATIQAGKYYNLKTYTNLYSLLLSNSNLGAGTIQFNKVSLPGTGNGIICVMRIYGTNNITFYAQNTSGSQGEYIGSNQEIQVEYTVAYYD